MRQGAFVVVAGIATLVVSGCGWFGGKDDAEAKSDKPVSGRVAVVDLDEVARRLGRDQVMVSTLKQTEQTLNEKLEVVQASYVKQIEQKQEKLGVGQEGIEVSEDDSKTLLGMKRQAGLNLNQARKQAINTLNQHRLQLIVSYRKEVKPVAREVAKERGLSVVLTKNDNLLFVHEDAVDITDEVAKRMRAISPPPVAKVATQPASQGTQQK
jgi:Skp family chaperone for outer membrane proteins